MDIGDRDLVRLARTGDAAAFRRLVERHRAMALARATRLGVRPGDADDIVQEAFLKAFTALGRLRDPDRFGAWLAGIVLNVHRAATRRAPPLLLADWPEDLHPASAEGLPSAEDLDLTEALRAALAGLPAGQRRAVELYYYAGQPAAQVASSPGAAKASLHKARRRLREYITTHRPDLIPALSRRTPMTTVRIACAQPHLGTRPDGETAIGHILVVLADEPGHRAVGLWLRTRQGLALWRTLAAAARGTEPPGPPHGLPGGGLPVTEFTPEGLAIRLLDAAGGAVTGYGELSLHIVDQPQDPPTPGPVPQLIHRERQERRHTITGSQDWTSYELTAPVTARAEQLKLDFTLAGGGQIGLRNVTITRTS